MITDISLVVTAIGVLGAVFGLRQSYLERLRQFELKYIDRYWVIIDRLSLDALRGAKGVALTNDDEKAIRSYFYLCEDELDMRGHGYITDDTYRIWASGIRVQLEQPLFAEVWKKVGNEADDEHGYPFANLHELMAKPAYDPLSMPTSARFVRGLKGSRHPSQRPVSTQPKAINPHTSASISVASMTDEVP